MAAVRWAATVFHEGERGNQCEQEEGDIFVGSGTHDVLIASKHHHADEPVWQDTWTDGGPENTLQSKTVRDCQKVQVSHPNMETRWICCHLLSELQALYVSCNFSPVLDECFRNGLYAESTMTRCRRGSYQSPSWRWRRKQKSVVQKVRQLQSVQPMQESQEGVLKVWNFPHQEWGVPREDSPVLSVLKWTS